MSTLGYNEENHMVVGGEAYKDAPELAESEKIEAFKEWVDKYHYTDLDTYSMFRELWSEKELFDFMNKGTEKNEFNKYKIEYLRDVFYSASDIRLTLKQVKEAL